MDLSGLIFVALAVAWAAYLIPKALKHHDDVARGRSVDRFSRSLRVLARREPVSAKVARLVVTPARAATASVAARSSSDTTPTTADRREISARATRRRRRVLLVLLAVLAAVIGVSASAAISWAYVAAPVALLVVWLLACRLMVRKEHAARAVPETTHAPIARPAAAEPVATASTVPTTQRPTAPESRDPKLWDPVPTTLPTYVGKPPARRSVRTIDLDSTGVWTSGRTEADSALARGAEAAEQSGRAARAETDSTGFAAGS